jgi:hypothetical protein
VAIRRFLQRGHNGKADATGFPLLPASRTVPVSLQRARRAENRLRRERLTVTKGDRFWDRASPRSSLIHRHGWFESNQSAERERERERKWFTRTSESPLKERETSLLQYLILDIFNRGPCKMRLLDSILLSSIKCAQLVENKERS